MNALAATLLFGGYAAEWIADSDLRKFVSAGDEKDKWQEGCECCADSCRSAAVPWLVGATPGFNRKAAGILLIAT